MSALNILYKYLHDPVQEAIAGGHHPPPVQSEEAGGEAGPDCSDAGHYRPARLGR